MDYFVFKTRKKTKGGGYTSTEDHPISGIVSLTLGLVRVDNQLSRENSNFFKILW